MKINTLKFAFFVVFLSFVFFSCEKKENEKPEQSEVVNKFLEIKTRMNAMAGNNGPMGDFMSVIAKSQFSEGEIQMDGVMVDSSTIDYFYCDTCEYPDIWEFTSCATITETDNPDGTRTTVYDYGDGCEEYGSFTKGKISYTWSSEGSSYYSKVIYDHYYSYGVEMNGYSEYSFESDGNSYFSIGIATNPEGAGDDTTRTAPDYNFNWSGTSSGKEDYTMTYDNGEKFSCTSDYSNKWDNDSYTVLAGFYGYSNETEGYEYYYEVTSPLVSNYQCIDTWIPVSGIETTTYRESGKTSVFTVDYGNGSCDNLAVVTEDGNTSIVDFGELYQAYYEESAGSEVPGNAGTGRK